MTSGGISTRRHIVESVVKLLAQRPSREIHLADVAERAHVGVQTIYYHFDSRTQLIAEAQALTYYRLTEPFHEYITKAEKALRDEDQESFWSAIGDNVTLAWSFGHSDDRWRVVKLLIDISEDPTAQRQFWDSLEVQFERWIDIVEAAKIQGWVDRRDRRVGARQFVLRRADRTSALRKIVESALHAPKHARLRGQPGDGETQDDLGAEFSPTGRVRLRRDGFIFVSATDTDGSLFDPSHPPRRRAPAPN